MNPELIFEGISVVGTAIYNLVGHYNKVTGRDRSRIIDAARDELNRQIATLQTILRNENMSEADLVPPKGLDELLRDAGMGDVVERNKPTEE